MVSTEASLETIDRTALWQSYQDVRRFTEDLCATLIPEDFVVQSMTDVSPTKWHLAHTSWFFETFLLSRLQADYKPINPLYTFLFNSYYNAVGKMHARPRRGLLSRPSVKEVFEYRRHVDEGMDRLIHSAGEETAATIKPVLMLGLNHEQQHQELLLTDIKHVLAQNPLKPVYRPAQNTPETQTQPLQWIHYPGGIVEIGNDGQEFIFDNEGPRHREFLEPFALASRLVSCGEFLEFIEDSGYHRPELWLSDGWSLVQQENWEAPLYWEKVDGEWQVFTLHGMQPVRHSEPVCHVSYYEADAYAAWAGASLPSEAQWETAAAVLEIEGNFVESGLLHPEPPQEADKDYPEQMYGDVWEWTRSGYLPYHGYKPPPGAIGEYNGKFMSGQMVLRGGSCATSGSHIRSTYRNFFRPQNQWQFMGIRLAQDL
ncbi:MAG: ergothioneine biosynthesis protein EgtB [Armatimonadetes bacterium]|nr:ergothioneine biosynthesis protein EgtB [Armatimonadota bacterium]